MSEEEQKDLKKDLVLLFVIRDNIKDTMKQFYQELKCSYHRDTREAVIFIDRIHKSDPKLSKPAMTYITVDNLFFLQLAAECVSTFAALENLDIGTVIEIVKHRCVKKQL
jgi:hypothetical protein